MKITPENILCIVPARSGSKGIKNKNIKKLAGIPLINYTLEIASKTFPKENIIISSDSKEIIKMGEPFEIKTPFLRPKKLASDYSKTIFTVLDIINRLENNYEAVCLLQPTSPFRSQDDIMNCISIINKNRCDSVVSVNKIEEPHPKKMKKIKNGILQPYLEGSNSSIPRQKLEKVYALNGCIYMTRKSQIIKYKDFFGKRCIPYEMPENKSININNKYDFMIAEYILRYENTKYYNNK